MILREKSLQVCINLQYENQFKFFSQNTQKVNRNDNNHCSLITSISHMRVSIVFRD